MLSIDSMLLRAKSISGAFFFFKKVCILLKKRDGIQIYRKLVGWQDN